MPDKNNFPEVFARLTEAGAAKFGAEKFIEVLRKLQSAGSKRAASRQ